MLTHRLALDVTGSRRIADLAAVILLSHVILILSSIRSMPDVLVCLFMLISAYGFLHLMH